MKNKSKKIIRNGLIVANIGAFGATATMAVRELRENNVQAGELYLALEKADEAGVDVEESLQALQLHVATHMNSSPLPQLGENAPVQLDKSYERAKLAESVRATAERERVNAEAIAYCESVYGQSSLVVRTQCVADYGTTHPTTPERPIVADLYRYDFVSPPWTPDKAGWLVLISIVLALTLVIQIVSRLLVNLLMKE